MSEANDPERSEGCANSTRRERSEQVRAERGSVRIAQRVSEANKHERSEVCASSTQVSESKKRE